jgi:hypothetical protein
MERRQPVTNARDPFGGEPEADDPLMTTWEGLFDRIPTTLIADGQPTPDRPAPGHEAAGERSPHVQAPPGNVASPPAATTTSPPAATTTSPPAGITTTPPPAGATTTPPPVRTTTTSPPAGATPAPPPVRPSQGHDAAPLSPNIRQTLGARRQQTPQPAAKPQWARVREITDDLTDISELSPLAGAGDQRQRDEWIDRLREAAGDPDLADKLYDHLAGWGPLGEHWRRAQVTAIAIRGTHVSVMVGGRLIPVPGFADEDHARHVLTRLGMGTGGETASIPGGVILGRDLNADLLKDPDGENPEPTPDLAQLVETGVLSDGLARSLVTVVAAAGGVVIHGPPASLLVSALADFLPSGSLVHVTGPVRVPVDSMRCPPERAEYIVGNRLPEGTVERVELGEVGAIIANPGRAIAAFAVVRMCGTRANPRVYGVTWQPPDSSTS